MNDSKFKLTKFHSNDSGFTQIRYALLPSGKVVAFAVAGTDLSTLQFGDEIDFDKESDELLEKHNDSKNNLAFEYVSNVRFDDVDTTKQGWFIFT